MRPNLLWFALVGVLVGCGATQPPPRANSAFVMRAEIGGTGSLGDYGFGALGAGNASFSTGALCCSIGPYVLAMGHPIRHARYRRFSTVLSAGLELSTYVSRRIGLMVRAGPAGTPPDTPWLGRRGFLGSGAVFFRITDPTAPEVGEFAPLVELGLGGNMVALNDERSSAGTEPVDSSNAVNAFDILVTLRIGANYGLDLK